MSLLKGKRHVNLDVCQEERIKGTFNRAKKEETRKKKNISTAELIQLSTQIYRDE